MLFLQRLQHLKIVVLEEKQRTTVSQWQIHFEYEDSEEFVKIDKRQSNSLKK
jgi:hypothetical protein